MKINKLIFSLLAVALPFVTLAQTKKEAVDAYNS